MYWLNLKGLNSRKTLALEFKNIESDNKTKCNTFRFSSTAETIINESYVDDVFESIFSKIMSNIQQLLGKSSSWIINIFLDLTINISKYKPLSGSSYIKITKRIRPSKKGLMNI